MRARPGEPLSTPTGNTYFRVSRAAEAQRDRASATPAHDPYIKQLLHAAARRRVGPRSPEADLAAKIDRNAKIEAIDTPHPGPVFLPKNSGFFHPNAIIHPSIRNQWDREEQQWSPDTPFGQTFRIDWPLRVLHHLFRARW